MHILRNISRSKDNHKMKFGQLIQHEKYFFEKSYTKCGGETISRPSCRKSKLSIPLDQQFKVLYSLCLFNTKFRANSRNIFKLRGRPLAFTSYKAF